MEHWSIPTKLLEAARRATPKLPAESREQFVALFSPTSIGLTAGVLAFWGASHLFVAGEVADGILVGLGVLTMGPVAFGAGWDLGTYLSLATTARTEADLDRAAGHLARAVVAISVTAFIALIMKAGGRLVGRSRMSARAATVRGDVIVSPAGERGPWWSARDYGEKWPGTAVPRGFILETGGRTFRVTINATKHMAEYVARMPTAGELKNQGVWSPSPWTRSAELDYPISSLAGALEQAAWKYGNLSPQRFPLEKFSNWELGIDTRPTPWVVEHAVPKSR